MLTQARRVAWRPPWQRGNPGASFADARSAGTDSGRPHVGIAVWPWSAYLGADARELGVRANVSSYTRHHPNVSMTKAKITGSYANSMLAKTESVRLGFDEAIMLDSQGRGWRSPRSSGGANGRHDALAGCRPGRPPQDPAGPGAQRPSTRPPKTRARVEVACSRMLSLADSVRALWLGGFVGGLGSACGTLGSRLDRLCRRSRRLLSDCP
ncbi:MAG: aminotransferase class IV [Acidobacteriota bacterium]